MKVRSLSHAGITVSDFNKAVQFYSEVFELKPTNKQHSAPGYHLTDGRVMLSIMPWAIPVFEGMSIKRPGPDHFGFKVDDLTGTGDKISASGGKYCYDFGDPDSMNFERKFRDPEGNMFDISDKGWFGALNE